MLGLAVTYAVAQLVATVWPAGDPRAGSPAGVVSAGALFLLLALFPTGRPVPRWTLAVALAASALFLAADLAGPDLSARWAWPLPLVPLLVVLVVGGQGYRYARRSDAAEREAARWPLLGTLLALTLVLPADLAAVATTGSPLADPTPAAAALVAVAMLLPAAGVLAGLLAPPVDLVDRLLALWLVVVGVGAVLAAVVAAVLASGSGRLPEPWRTAAAATAAVLGAVALVPPARRLARRIVFRGRTGQRHALRELAARLSAVLDPADVPVQVVESVRESTGATGAVLRRSGHTGVWAQAGEPGQPDDAGRHEVPVRYLGLEVATLTVWPRPAESVLPGADRALVGALAEAAGPALHGARLASAFPELTERERQVLAGIVRGLPNAVIAARLGVSGKTVANYVSIVLTKLRVPDRERAAELARRRAAELG